MAQSVNESVLMNQLFTEVFVEQPLASPGSANYDSVLRSVPPSLICAICVICVLKVWKSKKEVKEHLKERGEWEGEMPNQFWTDSKSKTCGKCTWRAP